MLLLHGTFGWDEAAIAVGAFGVLWLAVKLAGRKSAEDSEEDEEPAIERVVGSPDEESQSLPGH